MAKDTPWRLLMAAALALMITACDKTTDSANPSSSAAHDIGTAIDDKFAAFIRAANSESSMTYHSLPEAFYHYQRDVAPFIATGKTLERYSVVNPAMLHTLSDGLAKALSMPGALPPLDNAAQQYKASLDKLIPLSEALYDYAQNKTWLSDSGDLARRSHPDYIAGFDAILMQRDRFLRAISIANHERIKLAWEQSPENSPAHFRYGVVWLSRQTLEELNDPSLSASLNKDAATLHQLSAGWQQLLQQQGNGQCQSIFHALDAYLSALDEAMQAQAQGREMADDKTILPFNALVSALSNNRQC